MAGVAGMGIDSPAKYFGPIDWACMELLIIVNMLRSKFKLLGATRNRKSIFHIKITS